MLAKALPGTERLTLAGPDRYEGVMKVSVGPMTAAKFDVTVTLGDKQSARAVHDADRRQGRASASRAERRRSTCRSSPTAAR